MDAISFRCKSCQHPMKFSAEKAGKKTKCPKCGTIAVIQVEEAPPAAPADEEIALAPMPGADSTPAATPAGAVEDDKPANEFDDTGPATYEAKVDPELEALQKARSEEEANKAKQKKVKKKLPTVARKVKALPDAESWNKVRIGLFFIFIGCWIWLGAHLMCGSYVLLGSIEFPEFGNLIAKNLQMRGGDEPFPPRGDGWDIDKLGVCLEMIAGRDIFPFARLALTVATLAFFFQSVVWLAGYGFCTPIPRRFGMFGQVITLFVLAFLNLIFMFSFKLLPVIGLHGYIIIPYIVPEITLTEYNIDRNVPIHIMWSTQPFWENLLTLLMKFLQYLEPTFGGILLWSIGAAIKSEEVEQSGKGLTNMSLGTLFTLLCFHLLSLCGGSGVLVNVLRVVYTLWFFFTILFILRYAMALLKCRAVLYDKINPKFELKE